VQAAVLELGLVFELLHEVAVPVQARGKGLHGLAPLAGIGACVKLLTTQARRLDNFAHRQAAPRKVRRQPRTVLGARRRGGHGFAIRSPALHEKGLERCQRLAAAARLPIVATVVLEAEVDGKWQALGGNRNGLQRGRGRRQGLLHALVPASGPAVAGTLGAENAVLWQLEPVDLPVPAPGLDGEVPCISPGVAGFFV
jgi:hypothetical protein